MAEPESSLPRPVFGEEGRRVSRPPRPVKISFVGAVGTMMTCLKVITTTEDRNVRTKTKAQASVLMWNGSKPKIVASGGTKRKPTNIPRKAIVIGSKVLPPAKFIFSDYVIVGSPIGSDLSKIFSVALSIKDYKGSLCKEVMIRGEGLLDSLQGFVNEELYYFLDYEKNVGVKGYSFAIRKTRTSSIFVSPDEPRKLTFLMGEAKEFIPKMEPVTPQKVEGLINCGSCNEQFYEGEEGTGFCPCEEIAYCSQECATNNWKIHKKECKNPHKVK